MTTVIYREGDLFNSDADALGHGVNTHGLMGAGIAVQFRKRYPDMYQHYKTVCGQRWLKPGEVLPWVDKGDNKLILNIASQDAPGPDARLEWFESGLRTSLTIMEELDRHILAIPRIGCGIGGLEWADVAEILDHYVSRTPVDVEVWTLP